MCDYPLNVESRAIAGGGVNRDGAAAPAICQAASFSNHSAREPIGRHKHAICLRSEAGKKQRTLLLNITLCVSVLPMEIRNTTSVEK